MKTRLFPRSFVIASLATAALVPAPALRAQSSTWNGTAAGNATFTAASDWLGSGNWSPSGVPNATTANVTFSTGTAGNVFLGNVTSTTVNVGSLTFTTNGWTIRNSGSLNSQLTLNGATGITSNISGSGTNTISTALNLAGNSTFTLDTGDTLAMGSTLGLNGNTLTLNGGTTGTLSFNRSTGSGISASGGTIQVNSGYIRFRNGNHTMAANQTLTMNGDSSISVDGGIGFYNSGTTNFNNGTITTRREAGSGAGILGIDGNFSSASGSNLTISSNTTVNFNTAGGNRTLNSNLIIGTVSATLSANGSNSLFLTGTHSDNLTSAINIGSGTTLVFARNAGGVNVNSAISGNGGIARTASGGVGGSLVLLGNNTYTGITTLDYGQNNLEVGNNTGLGAGNGTSATGTVVTSGKLYVRGGIAVANEHVTINGNGGTGTLGGIGTGGNASWNGPVVIGASSTNPHIQARMGNTGNTFTIGGNITGTSGTPVLQFNQTSPTEEGNIAVTGNIGNGGATALGVNINLNQNTTRSVTFSGNNTYTGNTTVNAGTLLVNGNHTSATTVNSGATLGGSGIMGSPVTLNSGTIGSANSTLTLFSSLTTTGNSTLAATSTINNLAIPNTSITSGTFTVNGTLLNGIAVGGSGNTLNGSGIVGGTTTVSGGTIGGTLSLTTLVATGNSTIAGTVTASSGTSLNSGVLIVSGSLGGGSLTVNSGATLKGNGVVSGATTILGELAPGASPGLLTFGDTLTLSGSTTMEIDGLSPRGGIGGFDAVDVTNLLTYGGTLSMSFGAPTAAGNTYNLFDFGSQTGSFSSVSIGGLYSASLTNSSGIWSGDDTVNLLTFTFTQSNGVLSVTTYTPIPEPSAYAALAGAGMIGFALYRRRRQQKAANAA